MIRTAAIDLMDTSILSETILTNATAQTLNLIAPQGLGFAGDIGLDVNNFSINTSRITSGDVFGSDSANVTVSANNLSIIGSNEDIIPRVNLLTGTLSFDVQENISLAGGNISLEGFQQASFDAAQLEIVSDGKLSTEGDLILNINQINAGIANDFEFESTQGAITIAQSEKSGTANQNQSLASKLVISSLNDILVNTDINLHSGILQLQSNSGRRHLRRASECGSVWPRISIFRWKCLD